LPEIMPVIPPVMIAPRPKRGPSNSVIFRANYRHQGESPQTEGRSMAEKYSLEDYETVESRLRRLYEKYPTARLLTELIYQDERRFITKSFLYLDPKDNTPHSTGFAEEIVGAGFVNKTSALENCETSSIGRCLSNSVLCLGAPVGKRPSQEEMQKVERYKAEPRKSPVKKATFTADEIALAEAAIQTVAAMSDKEKLRELWTSSAAILDAPINGTTLKDVINNRVAELSVE
jgi:hypothetical protein